MLPLLRYLRTSSSGHSKRLACQGQLQGVAGVRGSRVVAVERASLREHAGFVVVVGTAALGAAGVMYSSGWMRIAGLVLLVAGGALVVASVLLYVWPGRSARSAAADPMHPVRVSIRAGTGVQNEAGAVIFASGPDSGVDIHTAGMVVNAGIIGTDQGGKGVRLADHARLIGGLIKNHALEWEQRSAGSGGDAGFAAEYARFGYGRQAGELYDSATQAGLTTRMAKAEFQGAAAPGDARQVAAELVRWADQLDGRQVLRGWRRWLRRGQ